MNPAFLLPVILVAMIVGTPARGEPSLVGVASVIDGDTIEIRGRRIRLHGIDAPESGQSCERNGRSYRCGRRAALALSDMIGRATVRCEGRDVDRYRRIIAVCRLGDVDLNAWMVRNGWAIAYRRYSRDYVGEENAARTERAGMWAGRFTEPWRWRRGARLNSKEVGNPTDASCRIKGNISRSGERIYHVPGGRYYGATRISRSKGERWFCSEDEARRAGWRRSSR